MDPIFKEDSRDRLPAVSNNLSGVRSELKPLMPGHGQGQGQGQAASIHSLPIVTTSLSPFPPLPTSSVQIKFLPSLPTPEQRKILLLRNIRAIRPQPQNDLRTRFIKKDIRPEKGSRDQPHTPPSPWGKPSPLIVRSLM